MSVVCAKVNESTIVFAADSGVWIGDEALPGVHRSKLRKIDGNFVVGGVGEFGEVCALQRYATKHRPEANTEDAIFDWIVGFYKAWRKAENAIYPSNIPAHGEEYVPNSYLIGLDGKLFSIQGSCVIEVAEYDAIGAGAQPARVSLCGGDTPGSAIQVAAKASAYVSLPVVCETIPKVVNKS